MRHAAIYAVWGLCAVCACGPSNPKHHAPDGGRLQGAPPAETRAATTAQEPALDPKATLALPAPGERLTQARFDALLERTRWNAPDPETTAAASSDPQVSAEDVIVAFGKDAIPFLVARLDDPSEGRLIFGARPRVLTMGESCFMVLERIVEPGDFVRCKSRQDAQGAWHRCEGYLSHLSASGWFDKPSIEAWWRAHEHMTLRAIQTKALAWKIAHEDAIGFDSADARAYHLGDLERRLRALKASQAHPSSATP